MKLIKKINNKIKRAPIRTLDFYNNLISGMVGGFLIYFVITIHFHLFNPLAIVYIIFLYLMGLLIIKNNLGNIKNPKSKKRQIKNYNWNILAALIGSSYIYLIISFPLMKSGVNTLIDVGGTLVLIIIFTTVVYFRRS